MCGIVGILGTTPVAPLLLDALKRLEYRGYNSAGVATLEGGHLTRRRAEGKLRNLEEKLDRAPLSGRSGIGHTRWATHGAPTETNAHPHATERLALVHNGIIENFRELKAELRGRGRRVRDRDRHRGDRPPRHAQSASRHGAGGGGRGGARAARGCVRARHPLRGRGRPDDRRAARQPARHRPRRRRDVLRLRRDRARARSPTASPISRTATGRSLTRAGATIYDEAGEAVERPMVRTLASSLLVDKGNHRHFMAKEIYEQPEVVGHTLAHYLDFATGRSALPADFDARLRRARPAVDHRLRHRLLCRAGGQILVRALRPPAGRHRYRLRVPLPRAAACREGAVDRRLAVGRDRRHARLAPLCQERGAEGRRDRQRAELDHRPRSRFRPADARRAGDRRRLDQGVHLAARGARRRWRSRPAGRAASSPSEDEERLVARLERSAALHEPGAAPRAADRAAGARASRASSMCSISAAAPATRSRSKAR